ncbi:hypothetical protein BJY16_006357 [Actinoplanes octamycinicus]|uniref:Uncharacterized protein n=1 Tax=Actinoplanes octamycinicus TaxID=135948 RepID=A0A7W7H2V0_9ACTN|nr:hypothetical protein [Actinoplanes octamycinicus]MBB4742898.1 hypothetical protein [Actinoplanes octamycinicus]
MTEALADVIIPRIGSPLLRREAQIATEIMVRYLNKPASPELAERAGQAVDRLLATVHRLNERSTTDEPAAAEAEALCLVLTGRWAEAAAGVEPYVGTTALLKAFVAALLLDRLDGPLTMRLLEAGQSPAMAVRSGRAIGKYGWWPSWLLKVVTSRALAGTLDEETISALDRCAYAELSPAQARVAQRLLNGDQALIAASAQRLETYGEAGAATRLREGDLSAVALAARLIPL